MNNETISDDVKKLHEELLETPDNHSVVLSVGFVRKLLSHYQATKELRWRSVDDAPKDGSKFIGLFNDGVFSAWRGAYNMYKPKDGGGYYIADKGYHWNYQATDSIHSGKLLGWMPLPTKGDE